MKSKLQRRLATIAIPYKPPSGNAEKLAKGIYELTHPRSDYDLSLLWLLEEIT